MFVDFYSKWMWTKGSYDSSLYHTTVFIRKYDRNDGQYISLAAFSNSSRIPALNFYKL